MKKNIAGNEASYIELNKIDAQALTCIFIFIHNTTQN